MLRWLDENIEKVVILVNYVAMTGIIFVEVIRRFAFGQQAPWSSTIPIYLFLWVTWIGCAYNCKLRAHLRFEEVRVRLPYKGQFFCIVVDHLVWIGFSIIVIYFSLLQVQISIDNFAIVQGTDDREIVNRDLHLQQREVDDDDRETDPDEVVDHDAEKLPLVG